jgi:hypothetical protein
VAKYTFSNEDATDVLRRLAVCAAFSTWCFFNTWVRLAEGGFLYFARYDPFTAVVAPTLGWELLVTLAMWGTWEYCRRLPPQRAQMFQRVFLALCVVPVGIGAVATVKLSPVNLEPMIRSRWFWPVAGVLILALAGFVFRRAHAASHFMREVFLYSTPLLAFTLFQAARVSLVPFPRADYADGPLAPRFSAAPSKTRVVWIIFDELGEAITFENRPPGLDLPNFDRLRTESFHASAADAPAGFTLISIPSLLLGQLVEVTSQGPADLEIQMAGRPKASWSSLPNVFDAARGLGFNTALAGWYHPYGRLLNHSLSECFWTAMWLPGAVEEPSMRESFAARMWNRARWQTEAFPLIHRFTNRLPGLEPGKLQREQRLERFEYLRDRAIEVAGDPSVGLAFLHLSVPHPPAIYDRARRELTAGGSRGYLDSVALADLTLGAVRRHMEETGVWNRTAVLVSSDHSWRVSMWRDQRELNHEDETISALNSESVPFLLKLPGQTAGVRYGVRFNTVVSSRIVTAVLAGELKTPEGIAPLIAYLRQGGR